MQEEDLFRHKLEEIECKIIAMDKKMKQMDDLIYRNIQLEEKLKFQENQIQETKEITEYKRLSYSRTLNKCIQTTS